MSNEAIRKSTRVERARQRLDTAVSRLETALAGGSAELRRELGALKAENAKLLETSETVSRRLDGAIGRLKAVLED